MEIGHSILEGNTYCDDCGKLKYGIFAGDPQYILCQCVNGKFLTKEDLFNFAKQMRDDGAEIFNDETLKIYVKQYIENL